jgi:hypothetical protein
MYLKICLPMFFSGGMGTSAGDLKRKFHDINDGGRPPFFQQPNMSEMYEFMAKSKLYNEFNQLQHQQAYLVGPASGPLSSARLLDHGGNGAAPYIAQAGARMLHQQQMALYESQMFYY